MERNTDGQRFWLTFELFAECKGLKHGIFLRHGGVSTGAYNSLNMGRYGIDLPENVIFNRSMALEALGIEHYSILNLEHGTQILEAVPNKVERGDALITQSAGLGTLITHADCQAAIFYDPIQHALANVHCGWRGSVKNIYQKTIKTLGTRYGSKPENLLIGISPSLGPEASEFIHYEKELPLSFFAFQVKPTYFDFWQISKWQLMECGILPHHIQIAEICTYSHSADFFSYRREKETGRHATIASLI